MDLRTRWAPILTMTLVAASSSLLLACGGGDDDSSPSSEDVPNGSVAVIGDTEITREQLDEQVDSMGSRGPTKIKVKGVVQTVAPPTREQLEQQALSGLLQRYAIAQEAKERGVEVSRADVRKQWDVSTADQFKTKKALKQFLGGKSEEDVIDELYSQKLYEGIYQQVLEENGKKAAKNYFKVFAERWRKRVACEEGQVTVWCTTEKTATEKSGDSTATTPDKQSNDAAKKDSSKSDASNGKDGE